MTHGTGTLRFSLLFLLAFASHAQIAPTEFSVEQIETECLAIEVYPVPVASDECTIVDSGKLTVVDGVALHYARYQVTTEVPFWPTLRDIPPAENALILFAGDEARGRLRIYRAYSENLEEFQRLIFPVPLVIETQRGKVLNVRRRGTGDGMFQWFNDEYYLWQWNDWQALDVTSWYADIGAYVPSGYIVAGVAPDFFDLAELENVSPVRKPDDADCCPSGGIVTAYFDWVDLALTIRTAIYDPDTDFRSL